MRDEPEIYRTPIPPIDITSIIKQMIAAFAEGAKIVNGIAEDTIDAHRAISFGAKAGSIAGKWAWKYLHFRRQLVRERNAMRRITFGNYYERTTLRER